ncbi:hypothetical protein Trydic_g9785 [Trypoxylus dichotomus]
MWGSTAATSRFSALGLVYCPTEYCLAVWLNSRHTDNLDAQLNSTMRIITGCIKNTPIHWLSAVNHIAPPPPSQAEKTGRFRPRISKNIGRWSTPNP